jgi:hypothetical protein
MSADHARAPTAKDVRDGRDSDPPAPCNADERKLTIHLDEAWHRLTVLMQFKMT